MNSPRPQPRAAARGALPKSTPAFLWHYALRRRWMFATLLALVVVAAVCAVGVQYGMKLIVDAMASDERTSTDIWRWLALFISLIAIESACWRLSGWLGCNVIVETGVDVRLDLFSYLSGHSLNYFSRHMSGALGNRITGTAGATGSILGTLTWKIIPPCVDFVGAVVVFMTIDKRMAFTLIASVVAIACVLAVFGIRARPMQQRFAKQASVVGGELVDVVSNIWTVQAFSARQREYRRLENCFNVEANAHKQSWIYLEKARTVHDICLWVMAGLMLIWAVEAWRAGLNMAGDVVVISALTFRILHGSRDLALSLVDTSQQSAVIAEMLKVVGENYEVADVRNAPPILGNGGEIAFDDVSFKYGDGGQVFRHLSIYIPPGQKVGIVGPSGAGKSTLIRLVFRGSDPDQGRVLIDGQDIANISLESLRDAIAIVPQDIALFHRSVRENIRFGAPDASDFEVAAAAAAANCEFIEHLPAGMDTIVGERGTRLSGGQRQRIGIARAILKNAPILLLDEATSALDSQSEALIHSALNRLMDGRTVLAVAHRLSSVAAFDRILVIVDGKVVEDGAPSDLRLHGGMYARLWELQAQGFETE